MWNRDLEEKRESKPTLHHPRFKDMVHALPVSCSKKVTEVTHAPPLVCVVIALETVGRAGQRLHRLGQMPKVRAVFTLSRLNTLCQAGGQKKDPFQELQS